MAGTVWYVRPDTEDDPESRGVRGPGPVDRGMDALGLTAHPTTSWHERLTSPQTAPRRMRWRGQGSGRMRNWEQGLLAVVFGIAIVLVVAAAVVLILGWIKL